MSGNKIFLQSTHPVLVHHTGRMRYWRISSGYGRYSTCSVTEEQKPIDAVWRGITLAPMVYIAWTALASPVYARGRVQEKIEPRSSVLGNRQVKKGEMSQTDMSAVLDYYMLDDVQTMKKVVRTSDLKVDVLKDATPQKKQVEQEEKKHQACDSEVVKVEFKAFMAVVAVCAVATAYWQWSRRAAAEATFGLDTELQDFTPIRDMSGETEQEKEYVRMEAMKRIQRAKQKEEEFRSRSLAEDVGKTPIDLSETQPLPKTDQHARVVEEPEVYEEPTAKVDDDASPEDRWNEEEVVQKDKDVETTNPLLIGLALVSTMVDDIKREIDNMPTYVLSTGRVLGCSRDGRAGKSMSVKTQRFKVVKPRHPNKAFDSKDLLLVPFAPIAKSVGGKKRAPFISDKYNPMKELHEFVSSSRAPARESSDRDPFTAMMHSLKTFNGFTVPESLRKYDPVSHLDQITSIKSDDDMISSFVRAIVSFEGPKASTFLSKYDPLQGMEDIIPEKGTSEYSILRGMLDANPHGASDYSIVKALLKASHNDVWKALVEVKPPKIDVFNAASSIADFSKNDTTSDRIENNKDV